MSYSLIHTQCILTVDTAWFVCTPNTPRTPGFALNSVGALYYQGSSDFFLCPVDSQSPLRVRQADTTTTTLDEDSSPSGSNVASTGGAASGSVTSGTGFVSTSIGVPTSASPITVPTIVAGSSMEGEWRFYPASHGPRSDCYSIGFQGSSCYRSDSPTSVMSAPNVPFPTNASFGSNTTEPFLGAAVAGKHTNVVAAGIAVVAAGLFGLLLV